MDVSKFLEQGNVKSNPNYNPKTKKGRLEQPTFTDYNPGTDIYDQAFKSTADRLSEDISYINPELASEKYTDYKAYVGANTTEEELNKERANNQSWLEQTGHMLTQAVGNEVVLGTLLGFGNLVDMFANIGKPKGEDDYSSAFTRQVEDWQNQLRERFDIYQKDPNATWALGDFGWWANNLVSVASSASMLIPSTGIIKGIGLLGKISKVANATEKLTRGVAKVLSAGKYTNTLSKAINAGTEIGATALLSRTMENYMEGRGVYNEVYDTSLQRLKSMTPEEKNDLISRNPNFEGKTDNEIASYLSSISADKTYANDFAMLLMDIAQFKAISPLWKGVENKATTAALRATNRNAVRELLGKEAEKVTWLSKRKDDLIHMFKNPLSSIEALELGEGIEEGYQGIQTEKGKEIASMILDPNVKPRDLASYLSDSSIWEQAFWGVIGGVGFQAIGKGIGNLYKKAESAYNKKHMSAEDYAKSLLTDEKFRELEIKNRNVYIQNYVEQMQLLNEGKNPYEYQIDSLTKKPIEVEGVQLHENITKEQAEELKEQVTNEFITQMTVDAVNAGNYDLLRDYLSDPEIDKYFKDKGIEATTSDSSLSRTLLERMDEVADIYEGNIRDVFTSADVDNSQVAMGLAKELTRIKLFKDSLNSKLNKIRDDIVATSDDNENDMNYLKHKRWEYINGKLKLAEDKKDEINRSVADGKISREAGDAYIKDIDESIERYNKLAERYNTEAYKDTTISVSPKQEIQDLVKSQIELEDGIDYNESLLPKSKKDFKEQYEHKYQFVDAIARKRFTDAVDKVNEWLEKQDNLNEATNNLIRGNVPELKNELQLLKIGYSDTAEFTNQINAAIKRIIKDRAEQSRKEKEAVVDGTKVSEEKAKKANDAIDEHEAAAKPIDANQSSDSSTGEETEAGQESPVKEQLPPGIEVAPAEEYTDAEKQTQADAEKIAASFDLDNITKAKLAGNDIVLKSYRDKKDLYNAAIEKGVQSDEANKLFKYVADELVKQGFPEEIAKSVSNDSVKLVFNVIGGALQRKGQSDAANRFRKFSAELALKTKLSTNEDGKFSISDSIPSSEIQQAITNMIDAYVEVEKISTNNKGRTIINIESLFDYIINNPDISIEEAKMIFYNIQTYIAVNANSKYSFAGSIDITKYRNNPSQFFEALKVAKEKVEHIDDYMHINAPTQKDGKYFAEIEKAKSGNPVTIMYGKDRNGNPVESSLSIVSNGVEIGFIATVDISPDFNTLKLRNQKSGFVDILDVSDANGNIRSSMDELIEGTIRAETDEFKELYNLASRFASGELNISREEAKQILSLPILQKYLTSNNEFGKPLILFGKKIENMTEIEGKDVAKVRNIARQLSSIIFYDKFANGVEFRLHSYNLWKRRKVINYLNTIKIEQALENSDNQIINSTLANIGNKIPIIRDENSNVQDITSLMSDRNPVMAVTNNGIINEQTGKVYVNAAGFNVGSMGMLIGDNPNAPIIAMFTEANSINISPTIENAVRKELTDIITNFQNGTSSFDETAEKLSQLLGGPKVTGSNFFSGFSVVKTSKGIIVNRQGKSNEIVLIINKFKKGTNEEGTGISFYKNADKEKGKSSIHPNTKFIHEIVEDLLKEIKFNRSFYTANNAKIGNEHSNRYIYKENGKLVVEIGGEKQIYDNYADFILKNNAFKTNQGQTNNGSFMTRVDGDSDIYIKVDTVSSPVKEEDIELMTPKEIIETATKDKANNTKNLLESTGVEPEKIAILTGENQFNISLVPEEYYYDKNMTGGNAKSSNGKVIFGPKGVTAATKNKNDLVRLLIHENLHKQFDERNLFERENIIEDLFDTYEKTIDAINEITNKGDDGSITYKRAINIKNWLDNNKFNPNDYFTSSTSKKQNAAWAKLSEDERRRIFAEEWLTESLSQAELIKFLNEVEYKGEEINVAGISNEKKSIWQKIIEILLKLFGKTTDNINNNTILAKQYQILGDTITNDSKIENAINENHSTETHGDEMSGKTADEIVTGTKKEEDTGKPKEETIEDDDNIVSQIETTENSEDIDNIDDLYSVTTEIPNAQLISDEVSINEQSTDNAVKDTMINKYTNEEQEILRNAKRDNDNRLLAPNGEPSNLTEKQYAQVRTKAFKDWFGDWETANNLLANLDKVNNSLVDVEQHYKPWRKDKTKGNNTLRIYLKDHSKGYFELVKDHEFGMYSVHFKTAREGGKYNAEATISTKEDRKILFKELIKLIPEGAQISTWGEISEDGIKGLNNVGRDFAKVGEREVTKKSDGSKINIPIYQKGESVSKVVDENGEPLVVYHGSPKNDIQVFDASKSNRKTIGTLTSEMSDKMNFFTDDDFTAQPYAEYEKEGKYQFGKIYDVFLNIRNPKILNYNGRNWNGEGFKAEYYDLLEDAWIPLKMDDDFEFFPTEQDAIKAARKKVIGVVDDSNFRYVRDNKFQITNLEVKKAIEEGYDGVIIKNIAEAGQGSSFGSVLSNDYVTTDTPNQIKSATDNIGTYSKENDDIRYATTKQIEVTPDEVSINSYRKDTTNNPNGFNTISNMNDYLNKFDDADKPMIAQMLASNEIKFICQ